MPELLDSPNNTGIYGVKVARNKCSREQFCMEKYIKQDYYC